MVMLAFLALAAVASSTPIQDLAERGGGATTTTTSKAASVAPTGFCSSVSFYLGKFANPASASSFCSNFETIKTSTVVQTSTVYNNVTASTTTTQYSTITPVVTESVTATCTTTASSSASAVKKRGTSPAVATSTSCSSCTNSFYPCSFKGSVSSPQKISTPSGCGTVDTCRSACFSNSNCASFSFDTSKNCQHYGASTLNMGLSANSGSSLSFWEKSCFSCTTTTSTVPTSAKTTSSSTVVTPTYPTASNIISSACSCLGVNPSPMTTSTVTVTTVTTVATNTITAMATATASSTITSTVTVATVSFYSNASYTAPDGDVYNILPKQDFLGYNLYYGYCGAPDGVVNTPFGNFSCQSFSDCINICSEYNDAAGWAIYNGTAQQCLGVTEHQSTPFCYLKSAVAGEGAPVCQVTGDSSDDDSAVLVQKHPCPWVSSNGTSWSS